jgi:hypothetical protein
MMAWLSWLVTPAEPRTRYAILVAIGVVMLMGVSYPVWYPGGPWMAAFAAVAATVISAASAKMIMRQ